MLNEEASIAEFQELLDEWRLVKATLDAKEPISMRKHWHPLYTGEAAWAP